MRLSIFDEDDAKEPLTIELVKQQVKLPPDQAHPEDQLITDVLIPAVRQRCESATGRQTREVTFDWTLDGFSCDGFLEVPRPPLLEVVHVKYLDTAAVEQTLVEDTDYVVSAPAGEKPRRGRIALAYGKSWPVTLDQIDAVRIRFRCGHGAADGPKVPGLLKAAMLLDAATLFVDRENLVKGTIVAELPGGRRHIYWAWKSHPTQLLEGAA
jgi:uncharacterized phiE125 gp8 family phage protein